MGVFNTNSMLANVYGRLSAAGPSAAGPSATIEHLSIYIYTVCGLASLGKSIFFSLYTIYQSCHEPVMLLMLHAVSLDQLSMKMVLKEGRGSQLSDRRVTSQRPLKILIRYKKTVTFQYIIIFKGKVAIR